MIFTYVDKVDGAGNTISAAHINALQDQKLDAYDAGAYASFAAAVAAMGATAGRLWITASQAVAADVTVPATLELCFEKGGELAIANGITVTFNGLPPNAGLYKIFTCTGTGKVVFGAGAAGDVHPEWWGANTAPGTTDMAAAIQASIDSLPGGGIVNFSPLTYRIKSSINLATGVVLRGCGYKSAISRESAYDTGIYVNGKSYFGIENLRVFGDGLLDTDCTALIYITNASYNGYVRNCFADTGYLGIVVGATNTTQSYSIDVSKNTVTNTGINAISINSYGEGFNVCDNLIYSFGVNASAGVLSAGIELRGNLGVICCRNTIRDGDYGTGTVNDGIRIEYGTEGATGVPDRLVCMANDISDVSGHGVRVAYATYSTISNNIIKRCGGSGIWITSNSVNQKRTEYNSFIGNIISECTDEYGIGLEGDGAYAVRYNTFVGNILRGCTTGINITLGDENTFLGNICESMIGGGISLFSGNGNRFDGNKTINNGAHGFAAIAGDRNIIVSHDSHGNGSQGIYLGSGMTNTYLQNPILYKNNPDLLDQSASTTGLAAAAPTAGTHSQGTVVLNSSPAASGAPGWVCTTSGTFSAATDNTGDTDGSTGVITGMADTSDFNIGDYITVSAGFASTGPHKILSKTSSSITVNANSNSSQTNITVSTPDPVFSAMANLA
jgi:hypothetical protein